VTHVNRIGEVPREVSGKFSRMGGELAAEVCKTIPLSSACIRVLQLYVRAMSPLSASCMQWHTIIRMFLARVHVYISHAHGRATFI